MTTHYILLTASKIIQPDPTRPGGMVQAVLNPKHRKLIPATCVFTEEQTTGAAVAEMGTHAIVFEETFDDLIKSLDLSKHRHNDSVVRIERFQKKAAVNFIPADDVEQIHRSNYAAERAAQRAASGARHQGELSAEEELGQILQEAKAELAKVERQPTHGDLKIVDRGGGDVFFLVAEKDEDGNFEWKRDGVARELRAQFKTVEAATEACRLAGYSRRLVTE